MGLVDQIARDIAGRVEGSRKEIKNTIQTNTSSMLLRRFKKGYGNLTVDQIIGIQSAMGHADGEKNPCKTCKIMAQEEFRMAVEEG